MTEGRDWARTQFEPCPDCGADAASIDDSELGGVLIAEVAALGRTIAAAPPDSLTARPRAGMWSALEYACHVRDLLPVMEARDGRIRTEDDPALGWWDHEAAAVEERYNEQIPVLVVEAMGDNARAFAARLASLQAPEWERGAERRPGERFTIRGIARFVVHEVIHHRDDAAEMIAAAEAEPA